MKEIVRELKIQREVDFHDNIIRCYGITKLESEYHNNYQLVLEYADGVHRDLHSCNILVRNNIIKLADFGLSKRIGASSNFQSKLFGIIPYVDPKSFRRQRNNNDQSTQMYSLNEKSDVYSVGILLWELSSGRPPFYTEGEHYDIGLALEITQGLRETIVPDTPDEYVKIYTKCWDGEPDNRPTIYQVIDWLNGIFSKTDSIEENYQLSNKEPNEASLSTNNSELQGELSQLIQNFDKMDTNEINSMAISSEQKTLSTEKGFSIIVDKIYDFISKILSKVANQNLSYSQLTLGYCYKCGIAANLGHDVAQYNLGNMYKNGDGIAKDIDKAIHWYKKAAEQGYQNAQNKLEILQNNQ
ncbi:kinase-like domain-containing protein [Rhizophagus irregularis DAOM 181602=DAOM 197198]|nr:kinase-like domain-containing protein [Rhizophagus irregularis DAOM 181602=DAOM 197198]